MKIGKYPVKHSYQIARLIADVFSLALVVLIFSATLNFFATFNQLIIGLDTGNNVSNILENYDPGFLDRQWLAVIFPALALAVIVVYLVLTLKSHKFGKVKVTKQSAQKCYDTYAFCVSLCKIPALLAVFDYMFIAHSNLLGGSESWFSFQLVLDILIIVFIVRFGMHRINSATAQPEQLAGENAKDIFHLAEKAEEKPAVKVTVKAEDGNKDTEDDNNA